MSLQRSKWAATGHQIGGFDREEIQQEFNLPDGFQPITLIAIGYEKTAIDSSEEEPRTRYPIEKNFFSGEWGTTILTIERSKDYTDKNYLLNHDSDAKREIADQSISSLPLSKLVSRSLWSS